VNRAVVQWNIAQVYAAHALPGRPPALVPLRLQPTSMQEFRLYQGGGKVPIILPDHHVVVEVGCYEHVRCF
jgi:hypothetical protein